MKKIVSFLFIFSVSFMVSIGQPTATLTLPCLGGGLQAGSIYTDVLVSEISDDEDFGTFQLFIYYDPIVLTPITVSYPDPRLASFEWSNNLAYSSGCIFMSWSSFTGGCYVTAGEVLCTIEWYYIGDPAFSDLTFNIVGNEISNKSTKEQTAVWSSLSDQYKLSFNKGNVGPPGPPPVAAKTFWTGTVSDDWDNPLNWTGGVPTSSTTLTIIQAETPYDPHIYGSTSTFDLMVTYGASLTIEVMADLSTYGLFTCDGDFEIMTEDEYGYSGSFIDYGGLAGDGKFYFTRKMFCTGIGGGSTDPFGWHYLASPVDGFKTKDLPDYFVNKWDEPTTMWIQVEGDWPCIPYEPVDTIDVLEAWSINYAIDAYCPGGTGLDIEFSGPISAMHTGPYSAPATRTNYSTYSGWNMFANPYPSGLNLDDIVWEYWAVPGAAFYDGCNGNYVYWSPALGPWVVAPGQGFFTECVEPVTFSLTGTERMHPNEYFFFKSDITDLLTLEINGIIKSDITHIRFMEEAEPGFARDGDFHKIISTEALQIYTTAGEDKLAINALPATASVPMGMTADVSGTYTIAAIETSEFDNVVLVEDLFTGIETDLLAGSYTFEYTTGDDEERFIVHFSPTEENDNIANLIDIWSNASNIYVKAPDVTGDIVVYNMMGQEVIRTDMHPGMNTIPMGDIYSYYVVKVFTSKTAVIKKVLIKIM